MGNADSYLDSPKDAGRLKKVINEDMKMTGQTINYNFIAEMINQQSINQEDA